MPNDRHSITSSALIYYIDRYRYASREFIVMAWIMLILILAQADHPLPPSLPPYPTPSLTFSFSPLTHRLDSAFSSLKDHQYYNAAENHFKTDCQKKCEGQFEP
jgi:hypothetical protein